MSCQVGYSLLRAKTAGLGAQRQGHSLWKPLGSAQDIQTSIDQGSKNLAQPRTSQGVPVFIPAAVFHVMQTVFNAPMLAK